MATTWTLLATDVCTDALQHLGVLGEGETMSAADAQVALRGLDVVLKELPIHGYTWPKLSAQSALTWASVQTFTLPTDYYGNLIAWQTVNGQLSPLTQIPHATWVQMTDRSATGTASHFYISPSNVFYVWPLPSTDPGLYVQYQKIVDDAALATTPDVLQTMKGALGYGVASEICLKYGTPQPLRLEIAQRWTAKRDRFIEHAIPSGPISFEVQE
jgi:hypothetical protein